MKLLTIFTPTYNRGNLLEKCYKSLISQSSYNFIWQIIDDGSTDNTSDIVNKFISEKKIKITYYHKHNEGKAMAINYSMNITNTPLWLCLDSDDYLTDNAVYIIEKYYTIIKEKEHICGLFGLRSNINLTPMQGKIIPYDLEEATQFDIRDTYHIPPEYVQVYKTKIVKNYRYPKFPGEKYVPLSYIQDQIDVNYKFYIIREPIMICEYLEDGITRNQKQLVRKYPKGYTAFKKQQIELSPNFIYKLKACITYDTGCILSKNKLWFDESPSKFLTLICYPIAILDYMLRYSRIPNK